MRKQFIINVSIGLLVLEVQDRILEFLVAICESIISGALPAESAKSVDQKEQPKPAIPSDKADSYLSTLELARERPYLPPRMDVGRLRSIAESYLNGWKNHAWEMRENPAYFQRVYLDWADHAYEQVVDVYEKSQMTEAAWNRAALFACYEITAQYFTWNLITQLLRKVERFYNDSECA
ncbi:unnamed protein product [Periconia digitata]|uniref:Uncharacterized protein n=1 Tax=Periconia digitata TaxID=1303443 RepID=A0A9W4USH4_9PLEO|nr:unnamed protein product [Periconia digitata]